MFAHYLLEISRLHIWLFRVQGGRKIIGCTFAPPRHRIVVHITYFAHFPFKLAVILCGNVGNLIDVECLMENHFLVFRRRVTRQNHQMITLYCAPPRYRSSPFPRIISYKTSPCAAWLIGVCTLTSVIPIWILRFYNLAKLLLKLFTCVCIGTYNG